MYLAIVFMKKVSICAFAKRILEESRYQQNNNVSQGKSSECPCANMISLTFAINTFDEEMDPITQAYGDKFTQEQVLELAKSKDYTYQRKGKGQSQNIQVPAKR